MRNKILKASVVLVLIILTTLIVSCGKNQKVLKKFDENQGNNKENISMEKAINEYIVNTIAEGREGKTFAVHKIFGVEEKEGRTDIYLYILWAEYSFQNNILNRLADSGVYPIAIVMEKDINKGFYVSEHKIQTRENVQWKETIKNIFPEKYHHIVLNNDYVRGCGPLLYSMVEKKAKNFYGLQ